MTTDELDRIEEMASKATKGPMRFEDDEVRAYHPDPHCKECEANGVHVADFSSARDWNPTHVEADAALLINARTDIPALIAEVRRLQAECARIANENAALVAQLPHGFAFPKDGDCRMVE